MPELDFATLFQAVRDGVVREVETASGRRFVIVREGYDLKEISSAGEVFPDDPPYIRGAVRMDTHDALITYARDFKQDSTRLFADINAGAITAVMDYHEHVAAGPHCKARGLHHKATLKLQLSEEWRRWTEISGRLMPQGEFARFLEENLSDIYTPAGADVLEVVRDLSASKKVDFRQATRLDNGDVAFEWAEETTAKSKSGELEVPRMFVLRIPVYLGAPEGELRAFLRWSLKDGALGLGIELHRPVYVQQATFQQIAVAIAEGVGVPMHYGAISG